MRGVPLLAALAAGASLSCGGDATQSTAVSSALPREDAGPENAEPVASSTAETAPLDCPPTRVISDVSDSDPASTISGAAVNIMSAYCANCHGPDAAEPAPSGPSDPTDFNGMIDDGLVIDCNAEGSPVIRSMRAGEMPPLDYLGFPATEPDIDTVASFIEFLCNDAENACAEEPSQPGCDEVLAARRAERCSW